MATTYYTIMMENMGLHLLLEIMRDQLHAASLFALPNVIGAGDIVLQDGNLHVGIGEDAPTYQHGCLAPRHALSV